MTRKTLVLGLALVAVTAGAVPALSAEWSAAGPALSGPRPEPHETEKPEDKDKDKNKDKHASPSPSPSVTGPAADETGCRNVVDGGATWIRPVTLPGGLGEASLGSGIIDSQSVLEAPSCPEVTYALVLFDSLSGVEVHRSETAGAGESTVQVREVVDAYDGTCVLVQLQVSEVVQGVPVVHDTAPDAPAEICDKGVPGSGGQIWR